MVSGDRVLTQALAQMPRQAFQFHGVIKSNLKRSMQAINTALLDTVAACGDVNRNVMCCPAPYKRNVYRQTQALADQIALSYRIQVDLDVAAGEALAERAQVALYQIIREAVDQAVRRGPPTRVSVRVGAVDGGGVETVIVDDSPGERRRRSFDAIDERARTLQGTVTVETSPDGEGTAVRITLPPYTAHR